MNDKVKDGDNDPNGLTNGSKSILQEKTFQLQPLSQKFFFTIKNITIEPPAFLLGLVTAMALIIIPSFLVDKICLATLSYSDEECQNLTSNTTLEKEVQNSAANLNMLKTIIETIPAVIFTLFLGPWSDRFGRKKTLLFPAVGGLLSMGLLVIIAYFKREIPPEVILLAALAQSLAGGILGIVSIGGSYLSDITSRERRTTRLAILQVCFMASTPIGSSLSGVLFEHLGGYITVFGVGFVLNAIAFVYILCLVKETVVVSPEDKLKNPFLAFFNVQNLVDNFKTVTKKRERNERTHLMLVFWISFLYAFLWTGESTIFYLYLRWKFSMSEIHFSLLMTIALIIDSVGLMLVPFLTDICKIPASFLGIASGVSKICSGLIVGLSTKSWMIFAGAVINIAIDMYSPVTRAICSQCVSSKEQGKVFSIIAAMEAAAPLAGSVVYTQVYKQTLSVFPSAVFLMSSGIAILPLIMLSYLTHERIKVVLKDEDNVIEMKPPVS